MEDVRQAAETLGISSEGVVRQRTLESDKGTDGRVFVWLDGKANESTGTQRESERDTHGAITRLENEVEWLRREVERKDTLLMTLVHRVPELEAPQRPPEAHQADDDGAGGGGLPATGGAEDGAERRSWWRQVFGF
jgi:hypothetical protein